MYQQGLRPGRGLTAIFAPLPLLTLFIMLGGVKLAAHWTAVSAR
jgi:hypothetical protein